MLEAPFVAAASLTEMVGKRILYVNPDCSVPCRVQGWLDSIDEGWAVVEFCDGSKATVRLSRIVGYVP